MLCSSNSWFNSTVLENLRGLWCSLLLTLGIWVGHCLKTCMLGSATNEIFFSSYMTSWCVASFTSCLPSCNISAPLTILSFRLPYLVAWKWALCMQGQHVFQLVFSPEAWVENAGSAAAGEEKGEAELCIRDWGCPKADRTFGWGGKEWADLHVQQSLECFGCGEDGVSLSAVSVGWTLPKSVGVFMQVFADAGLWCRKSLTLRRLACEL